MSEPIGPHLNQRWRLPIKWPPSEWTISPGVQKAVNACTAAFIILVAFTALVGVFVWGGLLYRLVGSVSSADSHEEIRNLLLGLAALLGGPFVIWRTLIASQQTQINRESHYTDLFTKAVEQLSADKVVKKREFRPRFKVDEKGQFERDKDGNPIPATRPDGSPLGDWESVELTELNREVRLGAIYALERIAQDSERDHWPIMETLTSYIRNNTDAPMDRKQAEALEPRRAYRDDSSSSAWVRQIPPPRPDIQAAMRVVGRRKGSRIAFERGADQPLTLDLQDCSCQSIDLRQGNFDFARFDRSHLEAAVFDLASMDLASFASAKLSGVSFLQTSAKHASFTKADLEEASLAMGDFSYANFEKAKLVHVSFRNASLKGAELVGANLSYADLTGADLSMVQARAATFKSAVISDADLSGVDLTDANLSFAKFKNVDFSDTELSGANLFGIQLDNVVGLTDEKLEVAFTVLDANFSEKQLKQLEETFALDMEAEAKWLDWRQQRGLGPLFRY